MSLEDAKKILIDFNDDVERQNSLERLLLYKAMSPRTNFDDVLSIIQRQHKLEDRIKRVVASMNKLPKKLRLVLILKYVRGVKDKKNMNFFQISQRTLYRWCNRGLVMFAGKMEAKQ